MVYLLSGVSLRLSCLYYRYLSAKDVRGLDFLRINFAIVQSFLLSSLMDFLLVHFPKFLLSLPSGSHVVCLTVLVFFSPPLCVCVIIQQHTSKEVTDLFPGGRAVSLYKSNS